jgi:hypothetical protein
MPQCEEMPKARSYCALQMRGGLSRHFLSIAHRPSVEMPERQ